MILFFLEDNIIVFNHFKLSSFELLWEKDKNDDNLVVLFLKLNFLYFFSIFLDNIDEIVALLFLKLTFLTRLITHLSSSSSSF